MKETIARLRELYAEATKLGGNVEGGISHCSLCGQRFALEFIKGLPTFLDQVEAMAIDYERMAQDWAGNFATDLVAAGESEYGERAKETFTPSLAEWRAFLASGHTCSAWTFAETGIGTKVTVTCRCGAVADVTEYDAW